MWEGSSPRFIPANINVPARNHLDADGDPGGVGPGAYFLQTPGVNTPLAPGPRIFAETPCANEEPVKEAVCDAFAYDGDIVPKFTSESDPDYPVTFLDIIKNATLKLKVNARISENCTIKETRKRPEAYYLLPGETAAVEVLKLYGAEIERLENEQVLELETYKIISAKESHQMVANRLPLTVKTEISLQEVRLPAGSFRVSMNQYLSTLMEF